MQQPSMCYVSIAGEDSIAAVRLLPEQDSLELVEHTDASGMPGPMCINAERRLLYAGLRSARQLAVYHASADTGMLTLLDITPLPDEPCYISLDRSRRYLFAASYRSGKISITALHENGRAGETSQYLQTRPQAHCIETDSTNSIAYIPHVGRSNRIDTLRFDAASGRLKRRWWGGIRPPRGTGPRHYLFHPRLKLIYVSNEQGSSVSTYRYHAGNGRLRLLSTQSTLPPDWHGNNLVAQIRLHPNAATLYVSNRGHDSIAVFDISHDRGLPALRRNVQTESCPRAINLTADGQHLLAAGQTTGRLALYQLKTDMSHPEAVRVVEIGSNPMWIESLQLR